MDIAIVGAGTVGTAVAVAWARAGHQIMAVSGREATRDRAAGWLPGVPVLDPPAAAATASVVVLAVPDDALGSVAAEVAPAIAPTRMGGAHVRGARPRRDRASRRPSARRASTADVRRHGVGDRRTPGVHGRRHGRRRGRVAPRGAAGRDLGAIPFRLADADRPLYHAAAVFASNYLVATTGAAARCSPQPVCPTLRPRCCRCSG